jgi:hypothetical protein
MNSKPNGSAVTQQWRRPKPDPTLERLVLAHEAQDELLRLQRPQIVKAVDEEVRLAQAAVDRYLQAQVPS